MDPIELGNCYTQYQRRLYLVAFAITMNRDAAEDAVHDALERMLRTRVTPRNVLGYLMRAVRNSAIDLVRRRRVPAAHDDVEAILEEPGEQQSDIDPERIGTALGMLRYDEREAIWLHIYADLSFREIAELKCAPLNTVTSWYRRGIEKLKEHLSDEHDRSREASAKRDSA